jgi:O-antigen/teichoic acid export membrane protein
MGALQVMQFVLGFGVSIVLARCLSPHIYGVFGLAFIVVQYFQAIEGFCLEYVLVQYPKLDDGTLTIGFWLAFLISLFFAALCWFGAPFIGAFFHEPALVSPMQGMSWLFPISSLTMPHRVIMQRELRIKTSALIEFFAFLGSAAYALYVAYFQRSIWALVVFALSRIVLRSIFLVFSVRWKPSPFPKKMQPVSHFALPLVLNESVTYWQQMLPFSLMGYAFKPQILGFFRMGNNLSQQTYQVLYQLIARILFPLFSRTQHDVETTRSVYLNAFGGVLLCTIFPAFFLVIFAPELVQCFYGTQWVPAIPLLQIMAFSGVFLSLQVLNRESLYAHGNARSDLYVNLAHVMYLGLSIPWALPFGITAVAFVLLSSFPFAWLAAQIQMNRILSLKLDGIMRPFISILLTFGFPSILVWALKSSFGFGSPFIRLVFWGIVWGLLSLFCLIFWQNKFIVRLLSLFRAESKPVSNRVVHISTVHNALDPRIFSKELKSLQTAGYEVQFVVQNPQNEVVEGIPITALSQIQGKYKRIWLQPEAYKKAKALNAEVYHFHDPELIPVAWFLKQVTGAKIVYDIHEDYLGQNPNILGRLIRFVEKWCFTWIDFIILASPSIEPVTRNYQGHQCIVSNYYKPLVNITKAKTLKYPIKLLYTGVIAGNRGLWLILDVLRLLKLSNLNWTIQLVGICFSSKERERFEQVLQDEGLSGYIIMEGWEHYVSQQSMVHHYQEATLGICFKDDTPNHISIIPTKFYEYISFGLPILVTDHPKWQEFVLKYHVGCTIPYHHAESVIQAVQEYLDHPEKYVQHAQNALETSQQFSWAKSEEALLAAYASLLPPNRFANR